MDFHFNNLEREGVQPSSSTLLSEEAWQSSSLSDSNKSITLSNSYLKADTFSEKLSREAELFSSLPGTAWDGFTNRLQHAWDHKINTGIQIATAFGIGAGLTLAARNPAMLGKALAPALQFTTQNIGKILTGVAIADVGRRVAMPVYNTWTDASTLEDSKVQLGNNIGAMAFDYPVMAAAGYAGAATVPRLEAMMGITDARAPLAVTTPRETDKVSIKNEKPLTLEDGTVAQKLGDRTIYTTRDGIRIEEIAAREAPAQRIMRLPNGDTATVTYNKDSFSGTKPAQHSYTLADGTKIEYNGYSLSDSTKLTLPGGQTASVSTYETFYGTGQKYNPNFDSMAMRVEMPAGHPSMPAPGQIRPVPAPTRELVTVRGQTIENRTPSWTPTAEGLTYRSRTQFMFNDTMADRFATADFSYSKLDGSRVFEWLPAFLKR